MCHTDIPQSLVPWGHLCVVRKHSSIICSLRPLCVTQHPSVTMVAWGYLYALNSHQSRGPEGIYVSHKHSLVTGALGASMCHTHSLVTGALGASMSHADTALSLVP
jgi:hypothetical protein